MRSNLIAGVDIGTTKTCAVIAEVNGNGARRPEIKVLGVGQTRTAGVRKEAVTHIEETTESVRTALREAELMAGVAVDRVYAGICGDHIRASPSEGVVAVGDDEIGPRDVDRVHEVARAVVIPQDRELLHAIPLGYTVDHQNGIKNPVGMAGIRLETRVFLITCASRASSNIQRAISRAGYRVQGLVLEPLATSLSVLTEDEKELGVALVELGGGTTNISVFSEGKIRHLAVLPWGGLTVVSDLVRGLSIPFSDAASVLKRYGVASTRMVDPQETVELPGPGPGQTRQVSRELVAHIVEQRLDEIFGLAKDEVDTVETDGPLGAGVVVTGGGGTVPGIVELAQEVFGGPVRPGAPGEGLTGLADSLGRPKFAAAAGLVVYGAERFLRTGEGASTLTSGVVSRMGAWLKEFF